jgi:TolA-binding protein
MRKYCRVSSSRLLALAIAGGTVLFSGATSWGDAIYFLSGRDKRILPTKNITITKIAKDQGIESVFYTTESGSTRSKPLEVVVQMEAEGEAVFNQAETEFAKGDLKAAGADYRKALNSPKEWIKHRADVRLLGISSKTGDFLGAVEGFVQLAKKEPSSARQHQPAIASAQAAQLETAVGAVNKGLGGASTETQLVLLPFLVELYNKQGNTSKAQATLDIMSKLQPQSAGAGNPGAAAAAADAQLAAKQAQAEVALTNAGKALTGQQYDKAIQEITSHSTAFSTPDLQARALFIIADAKAAQARTVDALEDAALAYMRVVAFCKSQPSAPDALYKTAVIEERLKKILEAKTLYTQIVNEFAGTKAATDAQAALTRINSGK